MRLVGAVTNNNKQHVMRGYIKQHPKGGKGKSRERLTFRKDLVVWGGDRRPLVPLNI